MIGKTLNIFRISLLTALLLVLVQPSSARNGEDLNITDGHGMKQGYWIIKGYMISNSDYNPNATVEEGEYIDNKKIGLWKKYWPAGTLKSEINYVDNRPIGEYSIYYENGQLEEQGYWDSNKNIGEFKRNHSNGNPQQEFYFGDNGKRNGIQKYYYDNGQLRVEVNIINGKESGVMKRYNSDGTLKEEKVLENGTLKKGSIKRFKSKSNAPVVKKTNTTKKLNTVSSKELADIPNEAFVFKPNGHNVLYNQNQQVTQIGDFNNGRLWSGKWHRYNADGILIRIEIYQDGKYIGTGVIEED